MKKNILQKFIMATAPVAIIALTSCNYGDTQTKKPDTKLSVEVTTYQNNRNELIKKYAVSSSTQGATSTYYTVTNKFYKSLYGNNVELSTFENLNQSTENDTLLKNFEELKTLIASYNSTFSESSTKAKFKEFYLEHFEVESGKTSIYDKVIKNVNGSLLDLSKQLKNNSNVLSSLLTSETEGFNLIVSKLNKSENVADSEWKTALDKELKYLSNNVLNTKENPLKGQHHVKENQLIWDWLKNIEGHSHAEAEGDQEEADDHDHDHEHSEDTTQHEHSHALFSIWKTALVELHNFLENYGDIINEAKEALADNSSINNSQKTALQTKLSSVEAKFNEFKKQYTDSIDQLKTFYLAMLNEYNKTYNSLEALAEKQKITLTK